MEGCAAAGLRPISPGALDPEKIGVEIVFAEG